MVEMAAGQPPWSEFTNPVTAMYHIACTDELPPPPEGLSDLVRPAVRARRRRPNPASTPR